NQEDLSISNYSHIGGLILESNKQYLMNSIQTDSSLAYQTWQLNYVYVYVDDGLF
ncbi:unnamed protein product, partial [Adineta steineri]